MARVDLRCTSCGYHFYVSDTQLAKPEGARCPSCLAPVGVTGPVDGGPRKKPVRVLEASPDTGAFKMKMGIGAGAIVLVVVAVVVLAGKSTPPPEPPPIVKPKPAARPNEKKESKSKEAAKVESGPKAEEAPKIEPT